MYLSKADADGLSKKAAEDVVFNKLVTVKEKCDAALVLGTGLKGAKRRAETAAAYYKEGLFDKIISTGGNEHKIGSEKIKESVFIKKTLVENGVKKSDVICENRARNTPENMIFSLAELSLKTDVLSLKKIAVVTEPFHLRRSLILARAFFPSYIDICGYADGLEEDKKNWSCDKTLINLVYGEIKLIKQLILCGVTADIEV